jgi:TPR repeat protein
MTRLHVPGLILLVLILAVPAARADTPDERLFQAQMMLAKRGDPNAQYYLGEMYEQGLGTQQNLNEAFKWYDQAAKKGNRLATRKIAMRKQITTQHERERAEENRAAEEEAARAAERARAAAAVRAREQKLANDRAEQEAQREAEKARAETLQARRIAAEKARAEKLKKIREILAAEANRPEAVE